ncbi:MAG: hypothetical protein JWO56_275 [Acidobacteria bacterium]|nr:hypothetical protein [Acidobacteriota bacterium]
MRTRKIARDDITGRFLSARAAEEYPSTTVVETYHVSSTGVRRRRVKRPYTK